MRRPVVSPVSGGWDLSDVFCPPGGMGRVGTESGDQGRGTLSSLTPPRRESGWFVPMCERDGQRRNTLWGSDTKHTAASSS